MSQAYTNLLFHIVFGTKERRALIDQEIEGELHAYLGGLVKEFGGKPYIINGVADHVHLLINLPAKVSVADAVRFVKANSTNFIKRKFGRTHFAWQGGYGAFSVSKSQVGAIVRYIQNQKEHHGQIDFKAEFEAMLKKQEIEYEEKYLWT